MNPKTNEIVDMYISNDEITNIQTRLGKIFELIIIPIWNKNHNNEKTWQDNILRFIEYHKIIYDDKIPERDAIVYNSTIKNEHYLEVIMVEGMTLFMSEECIDITDDEFEEDESLF
jgi:hypothetical protein